MVTTIGKEKELIDMFQHLISMDYDAIAAYQEAIDHLENQRYKTKLKEFMNDHERHVKDISKFVQNLGHEPPKGGDMKQWLTKGKVMIAELGDDESILNAMLSNEEDTNTAYERAYHRVVNESEYGPVVARAYEDEKRHKAWIKETIEVLESEEV